MTTVYILGAGSSAGYQGSFIGETSPVSRNFFQKALRVLNIHKIEQRLFYDQHLNYKCLFQFITKYWGVTVQDNPINIDMEEVFTLLHIEMEENPHCLLLKRACEEYMLLMSLTFDKILYGKPCPHHQRLVNNLHDDDVVISFNYDLLIDNALISTGRWQPISGYGIKCNLLSSEMPLNNYITANISLLKLHGSLNWLYCSKCQQLFTAVEKDTLGYRLVYNHAEKVYCNHLGCQHLLQPIIILPTMMKDYNNTMPFTPDLWRQAQKALAMAKHIVIIGYSFPAADYRTKWLFRKAMQGNTSQRKVTLVNHATGDKLQTMLNYCKNLMRTEDITSYATIADFTAALSRHH